jgi:hypothetical protein
MTALRLGVPKIGSNILPRMDYGTALPASKFPRRMVLTAPSPTNLMYDMIRQSYTDQGYSAGNGDFLNSERMWQDKKNPQWGAGLNS